MEFSSFPALLAGPIVRRVEPSQAYIWMATSSNYSITADLFQILTKEKVNHYSPIKTKSETQTISLGKNLYVHLIKITPDTKPFPVNQFIAYNIHFESDKESFDLSELGLLNSTQPHSIVYHSFAYPTFFIFEDSHEPLSPFLFGSCQKIHGEGANTLAQADHIVEEKHLHLNERPQALFLMGDQIYADDVAYPLIHTIHLLARSLMGVKEKLSCIDDKLAGVDDHSPLYKVNGRQKVMERLAKFSSRNASNHLMEFGEFAVMYLLTWSPTLWEFAKEQNLFASFDEAVENGSIHFQAKSESLRKYEQSKIKKQYVEQENIMANSLPNTYQVRRLLANIPTYMIFDDHDITDDWNITDEWKKAVQASPLGKHIITNGLTAYWAFQGWGNQPDVFQKEFMERIKNYFSHLQKDQMLQFHDSWMDLLWKHEPWHFVTPTTPKAIFLDTRTSREYEDKQNEEPEKPLQGEEIHAAQLVNEQGFKELTRSLKQHGWQNKHPLIIVSPTPVIGFELIESIVSKFILPLKTLGVPVETNFDIEGWKYNGKGLTRMLNQIKTWNPKTCIILSGDVHYGYIAESTITFSDDQEFTVKQITSSPIKNMSFSQFSKLVKIIAIIDWLILQDQQIFRYCDTNYQIKTVDKDNLPTKGFYWKDQLTYAFINDYSIIETENNIGFLSFSSNHADNMFIRESPK